MPPVVADAADLLGRVRVLADFVGTCFVVVAATTVSTVAPSLARRGIRDEDFLAVATAFTFDGERVMCWDLRADGGAGAGVWEIGWDLEDGGGANNANTNK